MESQTFCLTAMIGIRACVACCRVRLPDCLPAATLLTQSNTYFLQALYVLFLRPCGKNNRDIMMQFTSSRSESHGFGWMFHFRHSSYMPSSDFYAKALKYAFRSSRRLSQAKRHATSKFLAEWIASWYRLYSRRCLTNLTTMSRRQNRKHCLCRK